jgi:hypothetical protein
MAEDWLPEPPPPPAPKSSPARTVLIWLVLVGVFIAIYVAFSETPGEDAPERVAGYSGWWIAAGFVAGVLLLVGILSWQFGAARRFNLRAWAANEELAKRHPGRAAELYGELATRSGGRLQMRAVALFNRGIALLNAGDAAGAVGALLGADRTKPVVNPGLRQRTATELARAFAIGGDLAKAERWLDEARARESSEHGPLETAGRTAIVEATLRCRQGRFDDALAALERDWVGIEHYSPLPALWDAWLLRAFALASTRGPRDSGAVEPWLRLVRGTARPGAFDWMTARWPELATFIATHDLAVKEPRAAS